MSRYHKKALRYSIGGMLTAILAAWMMIVVQYPFWLNVHEKFGPDAEPWSKGALPYILITMIFFTGLGAFAGYGVCVCRTKQI